MSMTRQEAQSAINAKIAQMEKLESEIVELALEHRIPVTLGEDRQGQRFLILDDNKDGYPYKQAGDWMTSTESCN